MPLSALLFALMTGGDLGTNEISLPCNLSSGACTREFELTPSESKPPEPRDWWIQLVPPDSFHGMLEWHVSIWNGRKWEPESVFAYTPFSRDRTTVKVSKKTLVRVRVTVFPAGAPPPPDDIAIVAYTG